MPRGRKNKVLQPKKVLRIFCEGKKTEPNYINGYLRCHPHKMASVKLVDCNKNTPVELVDEAITYKVSPKSITGDEFWVVYDRESTSKYKRDLHVKALNKADANNINVALSNVCFEYWLLLHFEHSGASYTSFEDLKRTSNFYTAVKEACGTDYDKASNLIFENIKDNISIARDRAKRINESGIQASDPGKEKPFDINPYTGMPCLLDAIDAFPPKSKK